MLSTIFFASANSIIVLSIDLHRRYRSIPCVQDVTIAIDLDDYAPKRLDESPPR